MDTLFFLGKLLALSAVISGLIKGFGPRLSIAPTPWNSVLIVVTPALLMALWLGWQWQTEGDKENTESGGEGTGT